MLYRHKTNRVRVYIFSLKMPSNCVTFQENCCLLRLSISFCSFVKSSIASIGKGYPFRKNALYFHLSKILQAFNKLSFFKLHKQKQRKFF